MLYEPPDDDQRAKDKKNGKESKPQAVEFVSYLKSIKEEVCRIYKGCEVGGPGNDGDGKSPLTLLDEIEQKLMN